LILWNSHAHRNFNLGVYGINSWKILSKFKIVISNTSQVKFHKEIRTTVQTLQPASCVRQSFRADPQLCQPQIQYGKSGRYDVNFLPYHSTFPFPTRKTIQDGIRKFYIIITADRGCKTRCEHPEGEVSLATRNATLSGVEARRWRHM